ncbi:DUF4113 domain-containing protein [Marinobacter sp. KMM 10035]|uniref:DUF4113 domain-containing protein n=1 Tax=Marinobacter sp. KMM 10035 TaxID=3134034 RepID=UPI0039791ED5
MQNCSTAVFMQCQCKAYPAQPGLSGYCAAGPAAYVLRRGHLSPAYTARWDDLPKVR